MRAVLKWSLAAAALIVLVLIIVVVKHLPTYIGDLVTGYFEKKLPHAHFVLGEVSASPLSPGRIVFQKIEYRSSKKGVPELEVAIEALEVDLDLLPLLRGEIRISSVRAEKPVVLFRDGDAKPRASRSGGKRELGFDLRSAEINDGTFQYVRMTQGTVATLNVSNIQARGGPVGRSLGNVVDLEARGRIEKSGEVFVKVRTPLFEDPVKVDVDVRVQEQNLADLTPFFKKNAGVELHGQMLKGHGNAQVEGQSLKAVVTAEYKDFDLKLHKMHDRSEAAAFFTNLGLAIAAREKNVGKDKEDRTRGVTLKRDPGEPVVGFILRGLKEAALRVSMAR